MLEGSEKKRFLRHLMLETALDDVKAPKSSGVETGNNQILPHNSKKTGYLSGVLEKTCLW